MPRNLRLYFDDASGLFMFGRGALHALTSLPLVRGDLVNLELQIVRDGHARFNADGTAVNADVPNLDAAVANWIFALKDAANFADGGDYDLAQAGFNEDDPWHDPTYARFAMALAIPAALDLGRYYGGIILLDSESNPTHLALPIDVDLVQRLRIGDEATAPSGTTGALGDDFTIADDDTEVIIPITGLQTTGRCSVGQLAPTGDPGPTIFLEDYSTPGQLRVYVASAPGTGNAFNGHWTLRKLS